MRGNRVTTNRKPLCAPNFSSKGRGEIRRYSPGLRRAPHRQLPPPRHKSTDIFKGKTRQVTREWKSDIWQNRRDDRSILSIAPMPAPPWAAHRPESRTRQQNDCYRNRQFQSLYLQSRCSVGPQCRFRVGSGTSRRRLSLHHLAGSVQTQHLSTIDYFSFSFPSSFRSENCAIHSIISSNTLVFNR